MGRNQITCKNPAKTLSKHGKLHTDSKPSSGPWRCEVTALHTAPPYHLQNIYLYGQCYCIQLTMILEPDMMLHKVFQND